MLGILLGFPWPHAVAKWKRFVILHLPLHLPEEWASHLFPHLYQSFLVAEVQRTSAGSVAVQVSLLFYFYFFHYRRFVHFYQLSL